MLARYCSHDRRRIEGADVLLPARASTPVGVAEVDLGGYRLLTVQIARDLPAPLESFVRLRVFPAP